MELLVASVVILWVAVAIVGFLLAGTLRQVGLIQLRLGADPGALITQGGLDRGTLAPKFTGSDIDGGTVRSDDFLGSAVVLIFLSTSCDSCRTLAPHINEVLTTRGRHFEFLTLCKGSLDACREFVQDTQLRSRVVVDEDGQIEAMYDVSVTPFVYLINYEGRVLIRGITNSWVQVESLLDQEGVIEPMATGTPGASHAHVEGAVEAK